MDTLDARRITETQNLAYGLDKLTSAEIKARFDQLSVLAEHPWAKKSIKLASQTQNVVIQALNEAFVAAKGREDIARITSLDGGILAIRSFAAALDEPEQSVVKLRKALAVLDHMWDVSEGTWQERTKEAAEAYRDTRRQLVDKLDWLVVAEAQAQRMDAAKIMAEARERSEQDGFTPSPVWRARVTSEAVEDLTSVLSDSNGICFSPSSMARDIASLLFEDIANGRIRHCRVEGWKL